MTVAFWRPDDATLAQVVSRFEEQERSPKQRDSLLFHWLFNVDDGFYSGSFEGKKQPANLWGRDEHGNLTRQKTKLTRRQWIENYVQILPKKGGGLAPMRLNRAQRLLESVVLRMERAGKPVRITQLKSRQMGISTYVQAFITVSVVRGKRVRALVIGDTDARSKSIFSMADTMRASMPKNGDGDVWNLRTPTESTTAIGWSLPIGGMLTVDTASSKAAGRGGTRKIIHLTESAYWPDDADRQGVLASLPTLPLTYAFEESTANSEDGAFHDSFWSGWKERHLPIYRRTRPWVSTFFAWWQHEEYFWTLTYGAGQELPAWLVEEIRNTLDDEERWLLQQRYYVRGAGWRRVGYDQLAWRRAKIADEECAGDVNVFNTEYPSRPELAFRATGNPVFDPAAMDEYVRAVRAPVWRGEIFPTPYHETQAQRVYGDLALRKGLDGDDPEG